MKRKFLALILSVLMLVSLMPTMALAAGGQTEASVASITTESGTTYYNTLADAIEAASSGDTVTLIDNISVNTTISISKSATLNLNGKTLTTNFDGRPFNVGSNVKFTIDDGERTQF